MHPGRFAIEEKMLMNFGYPAIVRFVSDQEIRKDDGSIETWPALTRMQLINHREKGHIPMNQQMMRELAEQRALQEGIDLTEHTGQFLDHYLVSKLVMTQGYEALIKGEIKPDVKDTLAAAKLQAEMDAANKQSLTTEQMQDLIFLYFRTVQKNVDLQQWQKIMREIQDNPLVLRFQQQQQQRQIEGQS